MCIHTRAKITRTIPLRSIPSEPNNPMKLSLSRIDTGEPLFLFNHPDNTLALTFLEAVKRRITLTGCELSSVDLHTANLIESSLPRCSISDSVLTHVNATRSNFSGANFHRVTGIESNFSFCDFTGSHLIRSSFAGGSLHGSTFAGAVLTSVNFRDCDLSNTSFNGALLIECDFTEASISPLNLRGALLDPFTISTLTIPVKTSLIASGCVLETNLVALSAR